MAFRIMPCLLDTVKVVLANSAKGRNFNCGKKPGESCIPCRFTFLQVCWELCMIMKHAAFPGKLPIASVQLPLHIRADDRSPFDKNQYVYSRLNRVRLQFPCRRTCMPPPTWIRPPWTKTTCYHHTVANLFLQHISSAVNCRNYLT